MVRKQPAELTADPLPKLCGLQTLPDDCEAAGRGRILAAKNKSLAERNKSSDVGKATKKQTMSLKCVDEAHSSRHSKSRTRSERAPRFRPLGK
jgi:hypothetical protein